MRHINGLRDAYRVRKILFAVVVLLAGISAQAADDLYLRAVGGDWEAGPSEQYKMTLVKDTGASQVYNWTGKIPSSFIIADKDYSQCLTAEKKLTLTGPGASTIPQPVTLTSIQPNDPSSDVAVRYISLSSTSNNNNLLIVMKTGEEWSLLVTTPLSVLQANNDETIIVTTAMTGSFENDRVVYECTGNLLYDFRLMNNSTVIFNKADSGFLVDLNKEYVLGRGTSTQWLSPDNPAGYENVRIQVQYYLDEEVENFRSIFLMTEYSEASDSYAILDTNGKVVPLVMSEDGRLRADYCPGNAGIVVATYPEGVAEPSNADITGYLTNRGGITYYYDEKLTFHEGRPSEKDYMLFAEEVPDDRAITFFFLPSTPSLRLSCLTDCVHIPIYFYNTEGFASPHVRAVNTVGRLYTGEGGSEMTRHEVELFGADEKLWRFDLWIPENEIVEKITGRAKSATRSYGEVKDARTNTSDVILPGNNSGTVGASNLHLTFTDGASAPEIPDQFVNVPLIPAGVYALTTPEVTVSKGATQIYLMYEDGGTYRVLSILERDSKGGYAFDGKLPVSEGETIRFFVTTDSDVLNPDISYSYGAPADLTSSEIISALNSEADNYDYNGDMVRGSRRYWEIETNGLTGHTSREMDVRVEISPDGAYRISFGYNTDDFQTGLQEAENDEENGQLLWFSLQGERLNGPRSGLVIQVSQSGSRKILIPRH